MQFPHLFYVPSNASGFAEEGVLRFEHIQPVAAEGVQPLFRNGKQSFLTDSAWAVLQVAAALTPICDKQRFGSSNGGSPTSIYSVSSRSLWIAVINFLVSDNTD